MADDLHSKPADSKPVVAPAKPTGNVVAPVHNADAQPADPYAGTPYTGPSEIVPGGQYIRGAKLVRGKLMGGEIVNAHGDVLASFDPDQENAGKVEDGAKPE